MKYPAELKITTAGSILTAWFSSMDGAKLVLDAFSDRLRDIKEYSNRDEDPIFRFEGGGGCHYAVDLRKAICASTHLVETIEDVSLGRMAAMLRGRRALNEVVSQEGLQTELAELERRDIA